MDNGLKEKRGAEVNGRGGKRANTRPEIGAPAAGETPVRRRAFLKFCVAGGLAIFSLASGTGGRGNARAAGPLPAASPLGPDNQINIGPDDRCPACGMRPIKHPKFSCAIQLADHRTFYFCSPGCLLRAWVRPQVMMSVAARHVKCAVVREYFSGRPVDAHTVTWVVGSDVVGPMGPAIVPLAGDRHLAAFIRRHGGRHTFQLSRLSLALWEEMTGTAVNR